MTAQKPALVKSGVSTRPPKTLKPRYSGELSHGFWHRVRRTRDDELYQMGCDLQNLEERLLKRLHATELARTK